MPCIIFTDGACKINPGIGGWGVIIEYEDKIIELYGADNYTTNNKMELTAVIEALKQIYEDNYKNKIIVYSDSRYVIDGITVWINGWKKRGWKKVKNIKLWKELENFSSELEIEWVWVKSHSGNVGNERADTLANIAINEKNLA